VSKGELQGIFDVDTVNGQRQVVLTNDAIDVIGAMHPELKDKFWECGKCKADYAACSADKHSNEDAEIPTKDFNKLKQHINKGPIQIKKLSKELPYTNKYIHHLAKQDSREGQKEEDAESACIEDLATRHGVSLEEITNQLEMGLKVEMEHTEDMGVAKKIALDHLAEDPHYYTKLAKMEGRSENEERRLDPKCWKGYHKSGTKLKGGVRVNNCVKN
jgi:hypothetical protein